MAFKRLDANQDGMISREEAARQSGMSDRFEQLDQNRDGQLSSEEFGRASGGAAKP
jgi:Ca2+-binding EF-hand superfamily protein